MKKLKEEVCKSRGWKAPLRTTTVFCLYVGTHGNSAFDRVKLKSPKIKNFKTGKFPELPYETYMELRKILIALRRNYKLVSQREGK